MTYQGTNIRIAFASLACSIVVGTLMFLDALAPAVA
jgi:hypothetical protein